MPIRKISFSPAPSIGVVQLTGNRNATDDMAREKFEQTSDRNESGEHLVLCWKFPIAVLIDYLVLS